MSTALRVLTFIFALNATQLLACTVVSYCEFQENCESELPGPFELQLKLSPVKKFDFDWSLATGAEYYQLLERENPGVNYVQVGSDTLWMSMSLTVPLHARVGTSYKVRACNDSGCTESEAVAVSGVLAEAVGYLKASNTDAGDDFGGSVALSGDGSTLAVGAGWEESKAVGANGGDSDDSVAAAGAVYVFVRDEQGDWSQQAYVKASNTDALDWFGERVALSEDGSTLAVGASGEDSKATGVGGHDIDNSADKAGAVYLY